MFISPRTAIKEGWVTGIVDEAKQVQPNAIDFTLDRLFTMDGNNTFTIATDTTGKEVKVMRGGKEIDAMPNIRVMATPTDKSSFYIQSRTSYDMLSNMYVKLPEGVAALIIIRSSFCRNGLFVTSGLYDSGFNGHVGCVIHNNSGPAQIEKGIRIGQIMFVQAEAAGLYAGGFNHGKGTPAIHQVN